MGILVFESLLPVFLVIMTGLLLRRTGLVPEEHWRGIELLGYWLLFPVLVFESLVKTDLYSLDIGVISQAYVLALVVHLLLVGYLRQPLKRLMQLPDAGFGSVFQTSTRWNGFVALAMAGKLAGEDGVAMVALIMALTIPILNVVNVMVLTRCSAGHDASLRSTVIAMLKVPLIWGAVLGLAVSLSRCPLYPPLLDGLDLVGRAGLGIGLLTVGAGIRIRAMQQARAPVAVGIIAKLMIFPVLVWIAGVTFGITGDALLIMVLCAAVPTAVNGYVLARQLGGDVALYAATASLQVLVSMVTIPLMLFLVGR